MKNLLIIICLILIMASCSIHRRISREWKSSPPQERMKLLDGYFTIKENWGLGYARNRMELDSIINLIKK